MQNKALKSNLKTVIKKLSLPLRKVRPICGDSVKLAVKRSIRLVQRGLCIKLRIQKEISSCQQDECRCCKIAFSEYCLTQKAGCMLGDSIQTAFTFRMFFME